MFVGSSSAKVLVDLEAFQGKHEGLRAMVLFLMKQSDSRETEGKVSLPNGVGGIAERQVVDHDERLQVGGECASQIAVAPGGKRIAAQAVDEDYVGLALWVLTAGDRMKDAQKAKALSEAPTDEKGQFVPLFYSQHS